MLSRKLPTWLIVCMATLLVIVGYLQPTPWMPVTQAGVNTFAEEHDHHVAFGINLKAFPRATRKAARPGHRFGFADRPSEAITRAGAAPRSATWWRDWRASLPPDDLLLLPPDLRGPPFTA